MSDERSRKIEEAARAILADVDVARERYLREFPPKTGTEWDLIARDYPTIVALRAALALPATDCPRCGGSGLVLDATVNPVPCPECASGDARGTRGTT